MSIEDFLSTVPGFDAIEPSWRRTIASRMTEHTLEAGALLLRRGDPGDRLYVLAEGEVEIPVVDGGDQPKFVARLGPGDIVGEMALLTGLPRSADVVARSPVRAYALTNEHLDPLMRNNPPLAKLLTELLGKRLEEGVGIQAVGKYRLLEPIGKGGSAKVYAAVHRDLHRVVAAKMLDHSLSYDERFRRRFRREAQTIAQLNHPHIVQVHDTETAYATFFIFMEFLGGPTLHQLMQSQGTLPAGRVMQILRQVGEALEFAHGKGIVHRDVKPANCAVDTHGAVKLMDFGIAAHLSAPEAGDDKKKRVEGTPHFMAPEVAVGRTPDGRADIYSLGAMAFQLLTGHTLFRGDNREVMEAQVRQAVPDIRNHRDDLPPPLVEFVHGTLRKKPEERLSHWPDLLGLLRTGGCSDEDRPNRHRMVSVLYREEQQEAVKLATRSLKRELRARDGVRVNWADVDIT